MSLKEKLCVWKKLTEDSGLQYNEGNLRHCYWYCDGFQTDCKDYEAVEILESEKEKSKDER